ncbi:hypothetical protein STEG23_024544 [Scotinomys teguina]
MDERRQSLQRSFDALGKVPDQVGRKEPQLWVFLTAVMLRHEEKSMLVEHRSEYFPPSSLQTAMQMHFNLIQLHFVKTMVYLPCLLTAPPPMEKFIRKKFFMGKRFIHSLVKADHFHLYYLRQAAPILSPDGCSGP